MKKQKKELLTEREVYFFILGMVLGFSVSMGSIFLYNLFTTPSETFSKPQGFNPTLYTTTTVTLGQIPLQYVTCNENERCSPTCCGCINEKYASMTPQLCNKTCDVSDLRVCICLNGMCQSTNQPLPPEALPKR